MKQLIYILSIALCPLISFGQDQLTKFYPVTSNAPDLSQQTKAEIDRQSELLAKDDIKDAEVLELQSLLEKHGEIVESVWNIIHGGCSWYCGGGNYKVTASSQLPSQQTYNYEANSANDLSYETAWVEGKKDSGIGEYLEYSFRNRSPRITSIIISNGYMKSEEAWKNNNRVKSLKVYINGKAHGILQLSDTRTDQEFKLGTFGNNKDGSDLVLRFEILDIYKGDKYNDTAITEIYFDGIDVH